MSKRPTREENYLRLVGELDSRLYALEVKEKKGQLSQQEFEFFLILSNIRAIIQQLYVPDK